MVIKTDLTFRITFFNGDGAIVFRGMVEAPSGWVAWALVVEQIGWDVGNRWKVDGVTQESDK